MPEKNINELDSLSGLETAELQRRLTCFCAGRQLRNVEVNPFVQEIQTILSDRGVEVDLQHLVNTNHMELWERSSFR